MEKVEAEGSSRGKPDRIRGELTRRREATEKRVT